MEIKISLKLRSGIENRARALKVIQLYTEKTPNLGIKKVIQPPGTEIHSMPDRSSFRSN